MSEFRVVVLAPSNVAIHPFRGKWSLRHRAIPSADYQRRDTLCDVHHEWIKTTRGVAQPYELTPLSRPAMPETMWRWSIKKSTTIGTSASKTAEVSLRQLASKVCM